MNTYLLIFLTFLEIGAVSFGGGYGMIAIIREKVILHSWLTEEEFLNVIAVAESTPGPIAVNMATYVGSKVGGLLGSAVATLGVVIPSFVIILVIAAFVKNLIKYGPVKAFLSGIRPAVVGLIVATAFTMLLSTLFGIEELDKINGVDIPALVIFGAISLFFVGYKVLFKKKPSAITLILVSAAFGMIVYPIIG